MSRIDEIVAEPDYGPAPEDDRIAMDWLEGGGRAFELYVGGQWIQGQGPLGESTCPADGRRLAGFRCGTDADVDRAVEAARGARAPWSALGGHGRARYLYQIARQVQKRARLFAIVESLDNGKPIRESRDTDIPLVVRHFYHHAGWAQLLESEFQGYEPHGVVGQIVPWAFPLLMAAWKVAPALAAGNTVVLKPAEQTPLSALLLAEVAHDIGLPPGVLNVVTGNAAPGAALARHPGVEKIAFTGSTEVGREIRRETAGSGKHLSLELGGKSPFIVFGSADLDAAVEGVVDAIWFNQGEVCCAGSRLLVQESVEEDVLDRLRARMETLRVGHPLDKSVDMGAIISASHLERIREYVEIGRQDGGTVWQPSTELPREGLYYPPTLCTGMPTSSPVVTDEVFGPVLVALSFRTPDEAVALANDTRFGLAASVWTEDLSVALDVAKRLEAGTVWVNSTNLFDAASGFGGTRESGFGREGGREGMWEYVRPARAPRTPRAIGAGARQGYARVQDESGVPSDEIPRGNRKDVGDAVDEARSTRTSWGTSTGHGRAQVLYFLGEALAARADDFVREVARAGGQDTEAATAEVAAAIESTFRFAAWADKHEGRIHATRYRAVTLAVHEPVGTVAIRCHAECPLAGVVGPLAAALSQGNCVVLVLPEGVPVSALDLVQVIENSDVPPGVVTIVSGIHREVVPLLAAHDDVDQVWDFVADDLSTEVERLAAGNLKRVWVDRDHTIDWLTPHPGDAELLLRAGTRVKNIWLPYGA